MKEKGKRITPESVFYFLSLTGIIGFLVYAFHTGRDAWIWMIQENNPAIRGVDFFTHMLFSRDPAAVYEVTSDVAGCFPPLIYFMYHFFFRLGYHPDVPYYQGWKAVSTDEGYFFVYVIYSLLVILLLYAAVQEIGRRKNRSKDSILLFLCLMFSASFLGSGLFVGNSTMIVVALLMFALLLKDSQSKAEREVALILFAVCAALKIYPAVFGLLYLKEKRWKEAARLTVYGIVLFLAPFAVFGGVKGFGLWISHIRNTMGLIEDGRIQFIKGAVYMVAIRLFGSPDAPAVGLAVKVLPLLFLVLMIALAAVSKNKNRTIFFLISAAVFFPTNSFRYTLCYYAIPLVFWLLSERENNTAEDWIKGICGGMIFTVPVFFGLVTGFRNSFGFYTLTYVELWLYSFAYILLAAEVIFEVVACLQRKPGQQ